jgi:fructokinase
MTDRLDGIAPVNHGGLALRRPASQAVLRAIRACGAAPVFVDVNLRNPWWDAKAV